MDSNLPRWIFASVSKHFDDRREGIPLYIEGSDRFTSGLMKYAELRLNGPYVDESSKGYTKITIDINTLISVSMDDEDAYTLFEIIGIFSQGFTLDIPIYKYQSVDNSSQELLGCMSQITPITINNFGQIAPDIRVLQSTIDARYEMIL